MADAEQTTRTIPADVMSRHYRDKANALEGMAVTRLADLAQHESEVAHCHAIIAKLGQELQASQEEVARLNAELERADAGRASVPDQEE
jgi:uncharacterized small protein (DUF1192 family)